LSASIADTTCGAASAILARVVVALFSLCRRLGLFFSFMFYALVDKNYIQYNFKSNFYAMNIPISIKSAS
jgi:hypothetical protein